MIARRELDIIFLILFNDRRQETGGVQEVQVPAVRSVQLIKYFLSD